jgi:DNA mismatch repair protein PMS2
MLISSFSLFLLQIIKVINEVYHSFSVGGSSLSGSQHSVPFIVLNILTKCNPDTNTGQEEIDINVTPDKRSIFIQNEKSLLASLKVSN